jgi:hypothetical protein
MRLQKLAGIALIVGSLLFLAGVALPVYMKIFTVSDAQSRIQFIRADPTGWAIGNVLIGTGSVVAVVGLVLFARYMQRTQSAGMSLAGYLAAGAAALGAVVWLIDVNDRLVRPEEWLGSLPAPIVRVWGYVGSTLIALMITGGVLLRAGHPTLAWGMLIPSALLLVALLITGDMPPLILYLLMLTLGVALTAIRIDARTERVPDVTSPPGRP